MSANQFYEQEAKRYSNVRVNTLIVDGDMEVKGNITGNFEPQTGSGDPVSFLSQRNGFRRLNILDLQHLAAASSTGVLTNNGSFISFQPAPGGGNVENGVNPGDIPMWSVINQKYLPGTIPPPVSNVQDGTAANQIPFWNDIDNVYEPREFPENVENGFENGQIPVWSNDTGTYVPDASYAVQPGSRNQQVFLWSVGENKGYWGDLSTTPDFSIDTSGFGTQYGLNFIKSNPSLTFISGVTNTNGIAVMTSTNGSIQGNCLGSTINNSNNANIGAYANYCSIDASTGGANGGTGNIFNTDNSVTNRSTGCKIVASNNARISKGTYNQVSASLGSDGVNTLENALYCSVDSSQICSIQNGSNNNISGSVRSRITNSVRCSIQSAGATSTDVLLQNSTNVAAFGFTNWTSPSGLTNKVLGGLSSVQWCLHNDNGVLDIKSVNTAGTFPSGQSRYMDSEIELECGRLVRVNDDLTVEYAHDNEFAFGIVRHPDSAPLKFNACKSGMHKVTDLWGEHKKDAEGNYIEEYIECKERSLIETHGEYIVQSKDNKLPAGAYVVSDPNGFAKLSPNGGKMITNMKVFGRINSDDDLLIKNDTFAYKCYINPTF